MSVTCFVTDVETTGPNLTRHSMYWFGVVRLEERLSTTFDGRMCPITDEYLPKAMVSGVSWEEIQDWPHPSEVIPLFEEWVLDHTHPNTHPQWWSDNNSFDIARLIYYCSLYGKHDVLGHNSRNISDRHTGLVEGARHCGKPFPKQLQRSFKSLRQTKHDHTPVNDALGNAEALLALRQYGLKISVPSC